MKQVCITGGSGFIGQHLVRASLRRGWRVVTLDLNPLSRETNEHHTHILGDIRDRPAVRKAFEKCDAVIHLAAEISVQASIDAPEKTHSVNVEGTNVVLSVGQEMKIGLILHASSAAVYGDLEQIPLKETAPLNPLSPYGLSKKVNEEEIERVRENGLKAISFRFFNVYGPGQPASGSYSAVIPLFVRLMCKRESLNVFGDGTTTRDFVHVDDVATALLNTVECGGEGMKHAVYNLGSGTQTSLLELIQMIEHGLTEHQPDYRTTKPNHQPARAGDVHRSQASIERLMHDLDWKPEANIASSLNAMIKAELEGQME